MKFEYKIFPVENKNILVEILNKVVAEIIFTANEMLFSGVKMHFNGWHFQIL